MTVKRPVLLVVTTTFPRWKDDTDPPFVYELSKRLVGGFDVHVHAPHYPGAKTRENLSGCQVHRFRYFLSRFEKIAGQSGILPFLRKNKGYYLVLPLFLLCQFINLFRLIQKIKPDVIHAHWLLPTGFLAVVAAMGIPVVVTGHGSDIFGLQGVVSKYAKKYVLHHAQAVTVVSNALLNEVGKLLVEQSKAHIIPMGVDRNIFNCISQSARLEARSLLFVGRLTQVKGLIYLLEAVRIVVRKYPEVILCIVGGGEERANIEKKIVELGLEDNVNLIGAVLNRKLPLYYKEADLFISPSIEIKGEGREGLGITFIEASFSGCFLIGSNSGGVKEIIRHKKTGLLVEPASTNDLVESIFWAIENPDQRLFMVKTALNENVKKYDWQYIAKKYTHLLREAIASSNTSA